jgi:multidrug efflux pump subunit AcrB
MAHLDDATLIEKTHNTARYFTEKRQVAWVALVGTVLWGFLGFLTMPQRKDPEIPVISALVITPWPGMDAERVEERVTRRIEEVVAENSHVDVIRSTTRTGVSYVYVDLKEGTTGTGEIFDDIALKLNAIGDLPDGAGPIQFIKDFGSTTALMLTVATPRLDEVQVSLRAQHMRAAIERLRADAKPGPRVTLVYNFPPSISAVSVVRPATLYLAHAEREGVFRDARLLRGPQFVGVDGVSDLSDDAILGHVQRFVEERLRVSEFHPDAWRAVVVRDPVESRARLLAVAGDKYSYRELDELTDLMKRTFQTVKQVSKVDRSGVLDEQVTLSFSQERVASYGVPMGRLQDILRSRNTALGGGLIEVSGRTVALNPTGEFRSEREIGDVIVGTSAGGAPLYLRDLVDIDRGYESPPRYLNFYNWKDTTGWHRSRAVTLALQMRPGEKIGEFGLAVDSTIEVLRNRLPPDLILARTSDQPLQVEENIALFMSSLWEAVVLVVVIALVGFWEWRSATVLAVSIPLTLAMTFGMMSILGIDLQQISIASLIIALGLLVDDPVVAGDAIKRDLDHGHPPQVAAWLGPTKLERAILFATITNIVAYLPLLLLSGVLGQFLVSLPVVLAASLVASRVVSMTFIPLLGYYLLRPSREAAPPIEERRTRGFAGWYYRLGRRAIAHRWRFAFASLGILVLGGWIMSRLKPQFFPKDLQYLSYVEVWLPEDAPLITTREITERVEGLVRKEAGEYFAHHGGEHGEPGDLVSLTTFMGGGGPRFWSTFSPEPRQTNYALIVLQTRSKHDTPGLVVALQEALSREVEGARINVRELETGPPVGTPVAIRLSGDHMPTLRALTARLMDIFRTNPLAEQVQDDWGAQSFAVDVAIDPDRANQAGLTNSDVALSTAIGLNGYQLTALHEGDKTIPVVARLRMEERARLADLRNLYVYSTEGSERISLRQIASLSTGMRPEKINRRNQFRTVTVGAFPRAGVLASEVFAHSKPELDRFIAELPPGFRVQVAGELEKQQSGFTELAVILGISVGMIFLALAVQFQNAVKPLVVFGAIPYGMVGAVAALWVMGAPFGFMAFLGIVSLVGVIVSHVIVLFDFIEEARERGEGLEEALLDAGILRLRPVLITVGATIFALVPLALHGGPLWEPLCYAQIGGLAVATVVTLLLVPVFYSISVLDLRIISWQPGKH